MKTILLVEDNADDEELTLAAFAESSLVNEIIVARDGAEALDLLLGRGGRSLVTPSVILLDLKLPKIDGLEVLRQIRGNERTRLIPVIVLTSSVEERDLITSYSLGCNSYVRKPVDFKQFMSAAEQLGVYWLLSNQPPPQP